MITNYVCCEDCEYKNFCHNFDAFFGCVDGKPAPKAFKEPEESQLLIVNKNEEKDEVICYDTI